MSPPNPSISRASPSPSVLPGARAIASAGHTAPVLEEQRTLLGKADVVKPPLPALANIAVPGSNGLEAQLFDARVTAKSIAAGLSMHLSTNWRAVVYRQLDELLAVEGWDHDDRILAEASMRTFLRFVIYADATALPSLSLSPAGCIVASWRHGTRRLTMEYLGGDHCFAAISHIAGDDPSIVTFTGRATEARSFLSTVAFPLG